MQKAFIIDKENLLIDKENEIILYTLGYPCKVKEYHYSEDLKNIGLPNFNSLEIKLADNDTVLKYADVSKPFFIDT